MGALAYAGTAQLFWIPHIISGTGNATKKSPLKISGKVAVGIVRESRNFFMAPMYRAHRAVIFAIAQLSCYLACLSVNICCCCWWCMLPGNESAVQC